MSQDLEQVTKMENSIHLFYDCEPDAGTPPSDIDFLASWLIGEGWTK